ncbi:alpha/beta hydrolase [Spirosoma montaniterrae]|uniref:Phospholipase n=1 Tax=Spirosoma montaniterrae TaxID=1178516 RepID=A0A1P9WS44_9BACT|nr:phospholipase [Spirosoma montaniterrae]AQG78163.1 phospholipase [Spirosoma montaniterrae]
MPHEHHISVQRTARYYTLGQLTEQTTHVWFCLHGFGQLARYFSQKFTGFIDEKTFVVVPEGLSRLYLNGEYQRVGASWLTREDKDHEISDFLAYLNTLYDHVLANHSPQTLHITLLGFSQGAATACRWLNHGHVSANRLILWAGFFPNGLTDVIDPIKLAAVDTHYVYGRQDEFIKDIPDAAAYMRRMQEDVPGLQLTAYNGTHRVEPEVLGKLI